VSALRADVAEKKKDVAQSRVTLGTLLTLMEDFAIAADSSLSANNNNDSSNSSVILSARVLVTIRELARNLAETFLASEEFSHSCVVPADSTTQSLFSLNSNNDSHPGPIASDLTAISPPPSIHRVIFERYLTASLPNSMQSEEEEMGAEEEEEEEKHVRLSPTKRGNGRSSAKNAGGGGAKKKKLAKSAVGKSEKSTTTTKTHQQSAATLMVTPITQAYLCLLLEMQKFESSIGFRCVPILCLYFMNVFGSGFPFLFFS
jgi:hypothetical protein